MFGSRGHRKVGARLDGPVSIPREERVQLRVSSSGRHSMPTSFQDSQIDAGENMNTQVSIAPWSIESDLPTLEDAAKSPAWYGQAAEYATGAYLRAQILEPLLCEEAVPDHSAEEMARLLSCFARGQLLFLKHLSGIVKTGSIERVTRIDGLQIASWWESDKFLSHSNGQEWSEWWVQRCQFFDPGCEMIKLMVDREILAVAYLERNIVDRHSDGKRITLVRGIRICPKLNAESIRRSHLDRRQPIPSIDFPDVGSMLLCHIMYYSLRIGSQGVAVNSPKADSVEDLYEQCMGLPHHIDVVTGRRYYRLNERANLLRTIFQEQVKLFQDLKSQRSKSHEGDKPSTIAEVPSLRLSMEGAHDKSNDAPPAAENVVQNSIPIFDVEAGCRTKSVDNALSEQDATVLIAEDTDTITVDPQANADATVATQHSFSLLTNNEIMPEVYRDAMKSPLNPEDNIVGSDNADADADEAGHNCALELEATDETRIKNLTYSELSNEPDTDEQTHGKDDASKEIGASQKKRKVAAFDFPAELRHQHNAMNESIICVHKKENALEMFDDAE